MPIEQVKMSVGRVTYDRLAVIKAAMITAKGRNVTFDEVIEKLEDLYEQQQEGSR
jgi:hypothetical protein